MTPITLATLDQAQPQDIFNQVVVHARQQRAKARQTHGDYSCQYRTHDGLKCFAGALISDDEMEHYKIANNSAWCYVARAVGIEQHQSLISALQDIHDMHEVTSWDVRFQVLAETLNLDYQPQQIEESA